MSDVVSRRIVFQGLGAIGVAVALAGCVGSDGGSSKAPDAGAALATVDEVPVGGGLILGDEGIVITQPTEGEFKGFSSVCTHQGNTVTSVDSGQIVCSFHASSFSAETGEVVGGPAPSALGAIAIKVDGDRILAA